MLFREHSLSEGWAGGMLSPKAADAVGDGSELTWWL